MELDEWLQRHSHQLEKLELEVEKLTLSIDGRLRILERRLEFENFALTGLRWVVGVGAGAAIITLVNGWLR